VAVGQDSLFLCSRELEGLAEVAILVFGFRVSFLFVPVNIGHKVTWSPCEPSGWPPSCKTGGPLRSQLSISKV
jgi:hypothetical protein